MTFVYDPAEQLPNIFPTDASLANTAAVLRHIRASKAACATNIGHCLASYNPHVDVNADIGRLADNYRQLAARAEFTQQKITRDTLRIQSFDTTKQNLVLSMKVLKRLQMLVSAYNSLREVVHTRDYEQIAQYLGAVHVLMRFFRAYKSIDDIAKLHQRVHQIQAKLVDDVFIDFEDSFANRITNAKLRYGCEVLELIDSKNKDKLLTWFYNLQLKEILSIFAASGEAGSLENLGRRYIFFSNILANVRSNYLLVFPPAWGVDFELLRLFCTKTGQDISVLLAARGLSCAVLLDALTQTLNFEKQLNDTFHTSAFTKSILRLFEPFLLVWVNEQDAVLRARFGDFYAQSKIPAELAAPTTVPELVDILRVNHVPNFAPSSVELFRAFHKSLQQTAAVSTGHTLLDLHTVFRKYLAEYLDSVLAPTLQSAAEHPQGVEPIKYLTMVLNTADYVIKNTDDLQDKLAKVGNASLQGQASFDVEKNLYYELIGRAIRGLVSKVCADLDFLWKQFDNYAWELLDAPADVSRYMDDCIRTLRADHTVICPLIIRDSYVRTYADRLVETVVSGFMARVLRVLPLSFVAVEQILVDVAALKLWMIGIPHYSDPCYDDTKPRETATIAKAYVRHVDAQFARLETLLRLLLTPALPVDDTIDRYMQLVGDRSPENFQKFLHLKNISARDMSNYMERFRLQTALCNSLKDESFMNDVVVQPADGSLVHPASQPKQERVNARDASSRSPEPHLLDFLNNAKLQSRSLNNALRDLSLTGENHVTKINENFRSFGKFFRKDSADD